MGRIYVVETLVAKPGQTELLKEQLLILAAYSRKEAGCLYYNLYQDVAQSQRLTVLMGFADKKGYDEHCEAFYIQEFVVKYEEILYGEVIEDLYREVDVR